MTSMGAPNEDLLSILRAAALERSIDITNTDLDVPVTVEVVESNKESTTSSFMNTSNIEEIEIVEDEPSFLLQNVEFGHTDIVVNGATYNVNTNVAVFIKCLELSTVSYDIQEVDTDRLTIVIHYKDVTITNSNLESHYLGHCFIKFRIFITEFNFIFRDFKIYRPHITDVEYIKKYIHSHSNSDNFTYGSTCLGGSGIMDIYSSGSIISFDNASIHFTFLSFIKGTEVWLKWESLEGAPYKNISELKSLDATATLKELYHLRGTSLFQDIYDLLKPHVADNTAIKPDCTITPLISFDLLYTALNFLGVQYYSNYHSLGLLMSKGVLCYTDGNEYFEGVADVNIGYVPEGYFTFKGKTIKNKIISTTKSAVNTSLVVNPEFAKFFLTYIYYVYYKNILPYII